MTELITVPMFTFQQGDVFDIDEATEYPIEVRYYRDTITLCQNGNEINISNGFYKNLFKLMAKNFDDAQYHLNK